MAVNKSLVPGDVVVLEGEVTNTAMVTPNVFVVSGDFKLR